MADETAKVTELPQTAPVAETPKETPEQKQRRLEEKLTADILAAIESGRAAGLDNIPFIVGKIVWRGVTNYGDGFLDALVDGNRKKKLK